MCTKAAEQVGNLLVAEEPMVINLFTQLNIVNNPIGQSFISVFDSAAADLQNWKPGTVSAEVIEAVQDADTAFDTLAKTLPIPPMFTGLADIIAAGLTAALSLVKGNSAPSSGTTPSTTGAVASHEVVEAHQKATMETGLAAVKARTGYSPSHWEMARAAVGDTHVGANAIKSRWNAKVDELGAEYAHMKV